MDSPLVGLEEGGGIEPPSFRSAGFQDQWQTVPPAPSICVAKGTGIEPVQALAFAGLANQCLTSRPSLPECKDQNCVLLAIGAWRRLRFTSWSA
jgi:hypothetical protein